MELLGWPPTTTCTSTEAEKREQRHIIDWKSDDREQSAVMSLENN